jgi:hypothetical protein
MEQNCTKARRNFEVRNYPRELSTILYPSIVFVLIFSQYKQDIMNGRDDTLHSHKLLPIFLYVCTCIYVYVCVCVCIYIYI